MKNLSTKKLFVFDFDGTLLQSNAVKRAALYQVVAHIRDGASVLDVLLAEGRDLDRYGLFQGIVERTGRGDPVALAKAYTELCEQKILSGSEVPGAVELLRVLNEQGRICAINSATPEDPLRSLVRKLRFSHLIHVVYGKPASKAENLAKAMSFAGANRAATVMLGDGEGDRYAADQAGCDFIAVKSDNNDFSVAPIIMVDCLDGLIAFL